MSDSSFVKFSFSNDGNISRLVLDAPKVLNIWTGLFSVCQIYVWQKINMISIRSIDWPGSWEREIQENKRIFSSGSWPLLALGFVCVFVHLSSHSDQTKEEKEYLPLKVCPLVRCEAVRGVLSDARDKLRPGAWEQHTENNQL